MWSISNNIQYKHRLISSFSEVRKLDTEMFLAYTCVDYALGQGFSYFIHQFNLKIKKNLITTKHDINQYHLSFTKTVL